MMDYDPIATGLQARIEAVLGDPDSKTSPTQLVAMIDQLRKLTEPEPSVEVPSLALSVTIAIALLQHAKSPRHAAAAELYLSAQLRRRLDEDVDDFLDETIVKLTGADPKATA